MIPRDVRGRAGPPVELHPEAAEPIKAEPGTLVWCERLADGTPACLKLYRRGLAAWCRGRLTGFRARRELEGLSRLARLGVACSPPLFWSHGRLAGHGFGELLATRFLPGCRALSDVLAGEPAGRPGLDLTPLWVTVGRLHDAGLRHGTLFARNILVRGTGTDAELVLIDMPRFHRFPRGIRGTRMARYDLLYLGHSLLRQLPDADPGPWLAAYGMAARERAAFAARLASFRNTPRLRRLLGAEFNARALLARAREGFVRRAT